MIRLRQAILLALLTLPLAMQAVGAEDDESGEPRPKWEVGLLGGAGWQHHYPGAAQGGSAWVIIPYFIYRAERIRIGEGGLISGRIAKTEQINFTASISGSLPAKSKDDRAREGMPDLDTLFEVGPQVVLTLVEKPDVDKWSLKLPLRAVLSTDFSNLKYRGLLFQPRLAYRREHLAGSDVTATVSVGPIFAGDKLMDFFYDVPPAYATADRPIYEAHGGYMGTDLSLGFKYRLSKRLKFVWGGELTSLHQATNEDSPLLRKKLNYSFGAGFTWQLLASDKMVKD